MFERDKDLLRDFGVPLELVDTDVWGGGTGLHDPEGRVLPPGDRVHARGARRAAGGGAERRREHRRPSRPSTSCSTGPTAACWRGSPGDRSRPGPTRGAASCSPWPRPPSSGIASRFGYRTSQGKASEREVDAFAMVFRGGHWYLVGHDRDRDDVRAFRLSRFTTDLGGPGRRLRAAGRVPGGRPRAGGPVGRAGRGAGRDRVLPGGRLVGGRIARRAPSRRAPGTTAGWRSRSRSRTNRPARGR